MSRYAAVHANPKGLGDARPTAMQIVDDESMRGGLAGKVVVITGVSSGIGIETVRAFAATGAKLFLTVRDLEKAKTALDGIFDEQSMELVQMDLESLDSVRAAAKTILAKTDQITILVNNAGVMAIQERELTIDGYEKQFATNHLAHFLFFHLLKPALLAGSSPEFNSRVVVVSAAVHRVQPLNASDNYNYEKGGYSPWGAYGHSKLANIYMANELDRRYGARGLHATSLHPGNIASGLIRHMPQEDINAMMANKEIMSILKSPEQGAATTLYAAISKDWEGKGGVYLVDCGVAARGEDDGQFAALTTSSVTYNLEDEARLWKDSLAMVGLPDEE
ncbi:hypothetical protein N7468_007337 [Penicillium chermesinum]|uniref:Short-chain dehydrogenase n=1 Tax=Penicillium chermesinum TaxID=63820 RepID=A0A9W9TKF0_9EURO|nr:uncharacterized protein N7468_007337 [Penicillium chermesinum]KAJ5226112.1 hypothetical protein N7468_007337 [Penicillium chermesinum]